MWSLIVQIKEQYNPLIEKIKDSYNDRIVIIDEGCFSKRDEIINVLKNDYIVHTFTTEIKLRSFLNKNIGKRVIIFKLPKTGSIPFDIEESSEIIFWKKEDIDSGFPEPDPKHGGDITLKTFSREASYLISKIQKLLEKKDVDWGQVGFFWGRVSFIADHYRYTSQNKEQTQAIKIFHSLKKLEATMQTPFKDFIINQYKHLFFESFLNRPVTVDKVMPFLGQQKEGKLALICFDGMGFQEWFCLKTFLENKKMLNFKENYIFALLPTVTLISRRSLFSGISKYGKLPDEKKGFCEYVIKNWPNGKENSVHFFLNASPFLKDEYFESKYIGLVFNLVDNLLHQFTNINQGKMLFQHNLNIILRDKELDKIINKMLNENYRVFITSDHGSVYCDGMGLRQDKYLLETRAKRACLFPNETLASDFKNKDPELILYKNEEQIGDRCIIFSPWRKMFGNFGKTVITHGGMHIEEVVIPFVEVLP